jgi:hypothetical protein
MPTSSTNGQVRAWATTKWERADGLVFYQSPSQAYDVSDKARVLWEQLRCRYCILNKHNDILEQYRTGLPVPKNLAIANIGLLSKVLLKEVKTWLKEQF